MKAESQDIYIKILLFDIISYLDDKGIDYTAEGSSSTKGWINITCPFCDDLKNHLGINLRANTLNCWKCGPRGNISNLIKRIEGCNFYEAVTIIEKYQDPARLQDYTPEEIERQRNIKIPNHFQKLVWPDIPKPILSFVKKRKFDPETLFLEKELYYGTHIGDFKFRLVIPIYFNHRIVTYVGRDITDKNKISYLALKESESVFPTKELLYGFDDVPPGYNIVVVEGIIDQWKLGNGSVATFGTAWTIDQISLLRYLNPRKITILFDSEEEAQKQAKRLCDQIWFCEAESLVLEEFNDPGELTLEEGKEIMKEIQGGTI